VSEAPLNLIGEVGGAVLGVQDSRERQRHPIRPNHVCCLLRPVRPNGSSKVFRSKHGGDTVLARGYDESFAVIPPVQKGINLGTVNLLNINLILHWQLYVLN